jgi:hypothetical protein
LFKIIEHFYYKDYIRKFLEQSVIARTPDENFNLAAVRSHRGAIYIKVSDVDEASVSYVDEYVVEREKVRADDGSRYVRYDKTP